MVPPKPILRDGGWSRIATLKKPILRMATLRKPILRMVTFRKPILRDDHDCPGL
jgi:hypothetical protein